MPELWYADAPVPLNWFALAVPDVDRFQQYLVVSGIQRSGMFVFMVDNGFKTYRFWRTSTWAVNRRYRL